MKDVFTRYLNLGWSCYPVQHGGKDPQYDLLPEWLDERTGEKKHVWKPYQLAMPTADEVARWSAHKVNVAIVCGQISGIVGVDVDSETARDALALHGEMPKTPQVKTSHGWHYYFKHPGEHVGNRVGFIPGVDFRGDGGALIAPPSVHPSGAVYEWLVTPEECDPWFMPDWLWRLIKPPERPGWTQKIDYNVTGDYWLDLALQRAFEGTRDDVGFWLACQLRDDGLSYGEAENVLRAYASRVPHGNEPYTEREALAKVRSAWSQPPRAPAQSQSARTTPRRERATVYPEEAWHEGPLPEMEEGDEPPPRPTQHANGEKLWVDTHEVFARVFAEVLEEPETLSKSPPLLMPFNLLHQFGGFAHYAWRGKLMYVLGGPGFGKTSFGETMAETLLKRGVDWVWYGPEWSPLEMGYRAVHRNNGMSLDHVASYQVYRHDEARGVPPEQRGGLPMGAAVQSASINALDAMLMWPGTGYFIPKAALGMDDLLLRVQRAVQFSRERDRDVAVWFIDYLQIMRRLGAASDAMWGERLLGIFKDFCIEHDLLGVVFLQPRKDDTDRVRSAGMNAVDMNTDNSWLLDQNSAQGISDQQCNLYVTLNPRYDGSGQPTKEVKLNVVKNSLGSLGSAWGNADLARLRYLDSAESTAKGF